jgi:hypothetical protein
VVPRGSIQIQSIDPLGGTVFACPLLAPCLSESGSVSFASTRFREPSSSPQCFLLLWMHLALCTAAATPPPSSLAWLPAALAVVCCASAATALAKPCTRKDSSFVVIAYQVLPSCLFLSTGPPYPHVRLSINNKPLPLWYAPNSPGKGGAFQKRDVVDLCDEEEEESMPCVREQQPRSCLGGTQALQASITDHDDHKKEAGAPTAIIGSVFATGRGSGMTEGMIIDPILLSRISTSSQWTTIATYTYVPKSSSSHLSLYFDLTYRIFGSRADRLQSRITVENSEASYKQQIFGNTAGTGTRSNVIFPISALVNNTSTASKTVRVQLLLEGFNSTISLTSPSPGNNYKDWVFKLLERKS